MKVFWAKVIREPFLRVLHDVPWFGPVISGGLVGLTVNILSTALTTWGGIWFGWGALGVLALAASGFVYAYNRREQKRRHGIPGFIADLPSPERSMGLVSLFSNKDTLTEAIRFHQPTLQYCWLVITPEMQPKALQAMADLKGIQVSLHPIDNALNTTLCYDTVRHIFEEEAPLHSISPSQVIADITGGTKPMTMGMIMACLKGGYRIEHVPTEYGPDGRPKGPLPPKEIRVQWQNADNTPDRH